jgi:hypothetical protein
VFERIETPDHSKKSPEREFQIILLAKSGIGLSLVSKDPSEELLYAFMSNVVVDYQKSSLQKILDGSIQYIQVITAGSNNASELEKKL